MAYRFWRSRIPVVMTEEFGKRPAFKLGLRNPPKPTAVTPERALAGYQRYLEKVAPLLKKWTVAGLAKPMTFEVFLVYQNYKLTEVES